MMGRGEMLCIRDQRLAVAAFLGRARRRECLAPTCRNRTSHGKPYCLSHVRLMPYVQRLDELSQLEAAG